MNKLLTVCERTGHFYIMSYLEKLIGSVIFCEEIASFMMPLKDR